MRKFCSTLFGVIGIIGILISLYLFVDYWRANVLPTRVLLSSLEKGQIKPLQRMLLNIGLADYQKMCIVTRLDSTQVDYIYYPIISNQHPEYPNIAFAAKSHGGLANITSEMGIEVKNFAILVRDRRIQNTDNLPTGMRIFSDLDVIYVGGIKALSSLEQMLVFRRFGTVNPDQIIVLECGHTSIDFRIALMVGIFSLVAFVLNIALIPRNTRPHIHNARWGLGMRNPRNKNDS